VKEFIVYSYFPGPKSKQQVYQISWEDPQYLRRDHWTLTEGEALDLFWKMHDVIGHLPRPESKKVAPLNGSKVQRITINDD